jgi:hypothetical protein
MTMSNLDAKRGVSMRVSARVASRRASPRQRGHDQEALAISDRVIDGCRADRANGTPGDAHASASLLWRTSRG